MPKYCDLYRIILKTFGFRVRPVGTFGLIQFLHLTGVLTRSLDNLLFSGYRALPIEKPIFILGNPRSGTTFLHRFLLNSGSLCAYELWEMLFPAVSTRKLAGKCIDRLSPVSPVRYHSSEAHETSLRDVETDDAMAFFRFIDGGFLWSYFLAWDDTWGSPKSLSCFYPETDRQKQIFNYLEGCWRRNMYVKDHKRIIAKSSIFTLHVPTLLERYPDCKLIYVVRDPVEAIPSGMSLITGVLEKGYDMFTSTRASDRERYLENLYQASCHLYRSFNKIKESGVIPEENMKIVTYPQLMQDLESTMQGLIPFLEIEQTEEFWHQVRDQAERQRKRISAHQYSLEKFGLSQERIRNDLDFVYREYDV